MHEGKPRLGIPHQQRPRPEHLRQYSQWQIRLVHAAQRMFNDARNMLDGHLLHPLMPHRQGQGRHTFLQCRQRYAPLRRNALQPFMFVRQPLLDQQIIQIRRRDVSIFAGLGSS